MSDAQTRAHDPMIPPAQYKKMTLIEPLNEDIPQDNDNLDMEDEDSGESEETTLLLSCGVDVPSEPEKYGACRGKAVALKNHEWFTMAIAFLIVTNTVVMALSLDYAQETRVWFMGKHVKVWLLVNSAFLICFVSEICLRLFADGLVGFFFDKENWAWNLFDFSVVSLGVMDQLIIHGQKHHQIQEGVPKQHASGGSNAVMAARVLRILRVLRVVRVFKAFKKLKMLARGLLESVEVVFWIGVLVFIMLFICAIVCTTLIGQNAHMFPEDEQALILMYWGSVAKSMFTLFQFLTMDDWNSVDAMVVRQMPYMQLFFFPFIFFGAFVIMSLLTGVMADHMNEVRRSEEVAEKREKLNSMEALVEEVKAKDVDGDGKLDRREFAELFQEDGQFVSDLETAGLTIKQAEAKELFDWFDVNGDDAVDHEELRHGLKHLFEGLTPLQLFKLSAAVRSAEQVAEHNGSTWNAGVPAPSHVAERHLEDLNTRSMRLEERMGKFEHDVRAFMEKFGWKAGKYEMPRGE